MSSSASTPSPERLAEAIVHDVLRRRRKGEKVSGERVLQAYPDLRDVLEPLLRKADILAAAWNSSQHSEQPPADQQELQRLLARMDGDPELPAPEGPPIEDPTTSQGTVIDLAAGAVPAATADSGDSRGTSPDVSPGDRAAASPAMPRAAQRSGSSLPVRIPQRAFRQPDRPEDDDNPTVVESDPGGQVPTMRYCPSLRPPLGLLRVFDDDQEHAETIRIRSSEFVIGREQGDLLLSHDMQVSARHAAILRIDEESGECHWMLRDLQSANGVYLRVERMELRPGDRFLLANAVIRFVPAVGEQPDRLEEITPQGIGDTLPLSQPTHAIGRDASCERFLHRNPMIDPQMAVLSRDGQGTWSIECSESLNGLWQRVAKSELTNGSEFQLGEQRFAFHMG